MLTRCAGAVDSNRGHPSTLSPKLAESRETGRAEDLEAGGVDVEELNQRGALMRRTPG
jgi:hypothetical protein